MTRVSLIDHPQAPLTARPYYANGDPGPIVAALAHIPELLEVALPFIGVALGPSALDARTKEIVIVRTSVDAGCAYCTDTHTVVARDSGLTLAEVSALRDGLAPADFEDPGERALVAWVDEVATIPGKPTEAATSAVRERYGDAGLVELTLLVGATLMLNRFATTLGLPTSDETMQRLAREQLTVLGTR